MSMTPQMYEDIRQEVLAVCREKVAATMIRLGIATGHGDTIDDLLVEWAAEYTGSWNAALADNGALRKEIEALRGLLGDARLRSPAAMGEDREAARDLVLAIEWHLTRCDDNDDYKECEKVATKALTAARAQGEQSMRDAVLRWHQEQWIKYRDLSGTNGIAGAYLGAHERSVDAISALDVDNGEQ